MTFGLVCTALGAAVIGDVAALLALLIFGLLFHRTRLGGHALAYAFAVLIGIDITVNAIFGGRIYSTISCRVGESIRSGGWASHVHWPTWWVAHCLGAIHSAIV